MSPTRSLTLSVLILAASFGSCFAQERWQRLPPPRDPQFYSPRNKLEEFESRAETVLIKGRTWVGTLRAQNGSARVEATEIRDAGNSTRTTGVTVTITAIEPERQVNEIRCLIDYEETDPLIKAVDKMAKADDTITKLTQFEVHYRTRGDLEVIVFKQMTGGIAAAVEGGFFERTRLLLTLDELVKLRWMISQAKDRLDEIK
jgi:hypothetical protein